MQSREAQRVKEALEPAKPPATKLHPRDARKAWVRAGLEQMRRGSERSDYAPPWLGILRFTALAAPGGA